MATHMLCQRPSLMGSPGLPCAAASSSSSSGSCCCALSRRGYGFSPLHLSTSRRQRGDSRHRLTMNLKVTALDSEVFRDKTMDDLNPLSKQRTQVETPATSPVSVIDREVDNLPLERLKNGFQKFKENYQKDPALVKKLAEGQQPLYLIIACADSRVDPCTVLSLGPGEAFVLRNIGNMVPPYSGNSCCSTASAIEFAVLHVKVKHIVVIGHSRCAAIRTLMGIKEDGSNRFSEFIEDWVLVSKGAKKKVKSLHHGASFDDQCTSCEKEAVNHSLQNCLSYAFVREKIVSGELSLHGGYYDFVNCAFEHWSLDVSSLEEVEKMQ